MKIYKRRGENPQGKKKTYVFFEIGTVGYDLVQRLRREYDTKTVDAIFVELMEYFFADRDANEKGKK